MDAAITYRAAMVEDALSICELGQLLNAVHHAARPDIYADSTQDFSRDLPHWSGLFEKPGQVVFIASVGHQAAAFITAGLSTSSGPLLQPLNVVRIGSICVAEQFWGKGIGRRLIQLVKNWAIENDSGLEVVRLAVQCTCCSHVHRVRV